ncbi:MAG: hypothetical protein JNJ88_11155 [Planctomycetes bacterium]|nr:hypothetical protein [Planctomycetota bacterium]
MVAILRLLASLAVLAAPQGTERSVRRYPLKALSASLTDPQGPRFGSFLTNEADPPESLEASFFSNRRPGVSLSTAELLTLLQGAIQSTEVTLDVRGDALVAVATEPQHQQISALLTALESIITKPLSIEVQLFQLPAEKAQPLPHQVAPAEAPALLEKLRSNGVEIWSGIVDAIPGRIAEGGAIQRTPYTSSFSTEVAQKSAIAAPFMKTAGSGAHIGIDASPTLDGTAALLVAALGRGELLGLTRFDTRAKDVGSVDQPRLAGSRILTTAVVPLDGLLVLASCDRDAESRAIVACLRPRGPVRPPMLPPAASPGRALALVRTDLLQGEQGRVAAMLDASLRPVPMDEHRVSREGGLAELLRGGESAVRLEDLPSGYLSLMGTEPEVQSALARLRAQEELESASCGIRVEVVRSSDERAAVAAETVLFSQSYTVALGRVAAAMTGREESAVVGYGAEIAQEAAIAAPIVRDLFRGLVSRAQLLRAGADFSRIQLDLQWSDFGPRERITSEISPAGDHERVALRSARASRILELPHGKLTVVADLGPDGGSRLFVRCIAQRR